MKRLTSAYLATKEMYIKKKISKHAKVGLEVNGEELGSVSGQDGNTTTTKGETTGDGGEQSIGRY